MVDWADVLSRANSGGLGGSGLASSSAQSAFSGGGQAQSPMVYMGKREVEVDRPGSTAPGSPWERGGSRPSYMLEGSKVLPAEEVSASWYDMDDEERNEFAAYLVRIGAIDPDDVTDYDALQSLWEKGIELSSGYTARGKQVTPREALATWVGWDGSGESAAARARAAAAAEAEPFTGSRTQRSTSVNLSDPKSAKSMANYALSKALGREALPEELAAYRNALNSYEEANPSVSTTTAEYKDGIQTSQSTTTQGGATAAGSEQVLTDVAREEDDYAEYQAAGPIFNAMLAALSSPVQI